MQSALMHLLRRVRALETTNQQLQAHVGMDPGAGGNGGGPSTAADHPSAEARARAAEAALLQMRERFAALSAETSRRLERIEARVAAGEEGLGALAQGKAVETARNAGATQDLEGQLIDARGAIESLQRQLASEAHERNALGTEARRNAEALRKLMVDKEAGLSARLEALTFETRRKTTDALDADGQLQAFKEDKAVHEAVLVSNRLKRIEGALKDERRDRLAFEKAMAEQVELRLAASTTALSRERHAEDARSKDVLKTVESRLMHMDKLLAEQQTEGTANQRTVDRALREGLGSLKAAVVSVKEGAEKSTDRVQDVLRAEIAARIKNFKALEERMEGRVEVARKEITQGVATAKALIKEQGAQIAALETRTHNELGDVEKSVKKAMEEPLAALGKDVGELREMLVEDGDKIVAEGKAWRQAIQSGTDDFQRLQASAATKDAVEAEVQRLDAAVRAAQATGDEGKAAADAARRACQAEAVDRRAAVEALEARVVGEGDELRKQVRELAGAVVVEEQERQGAFEAAQQSIEREAALRASGQLQCVEEAVSRARTVVEKGFEATRDLVRAESNAREAAVKECGAEAAAGAARAREEAIKTGEASVGALEAAVATARIEAGALREQLGEEGQKIRRQIEQVEAGQSRGWKRLDQDLRAAIEKEAQVRQVCDARVMELHARRVGAMEAALKGRLDHGLAATKAVCAANIQAEVTARLASWKALRVELHNQAAAHQAWLVAETSKSIEGLATELRRRLEAEAADRAASDAALKRAADNRHDADDAARHVKEAMDAMVSQLADEASAEQLRGVEAALYGKHEQLASKVDAETAAQTARVAAVAADLVSACDERRDALEEVTNKLNGAVDEIAGARREEIEVRCCVDFLVDAVAGQASLEDCADHAVVELRANLAEETTVREKDVANALDLAADAVKVGQVGFFWAVLGCWREGWAMRGFVSSGWRAG